MNPTVLAYAKIAAAMAIVGSSVVVGKLIVSSFPVFLASELRFVVSSAVLLFLLSRERHRLPSVRPRDGFVLFLQAFAGVFLFNVFMLYGLKFTSAAEAGIVMSTLPAAIGLVSWLFLKESMTLRKGAGIACAVLGVALMHLLEIGAETGLGWFGNLLVFGAVLGETLFITLGKFVSGRLSPLLISTMMSLWGLILFLPFSVYEALTFDFTRPGAADWFNILYFGVVVTVIAFLLMYQGLAQVPAGATGVFTSVLPVSSLLLSYFLLREPFQWTHLLGILFVLAAIALVSGDGVPLGEGNKS